MLLGFAQILIFLSFPPKIVKDCPQSFGQIASGFALREKLLLSKPTRKPTKCFTLCITEDKRFVIPHANFSILWGNS